MVEARKIERDVFDVVEDTYEVREDAALDSGRDDDFGFVCSVHSEMPSNARRRGVLRSATLSRSRSAPRNVTGPRRAVPSVA